MKDEIIRKIQTKKNPNEVEGFLILCEQVKSISPKFERARQSILSQLEQIELSRLKYMKAKEEADKKIGDLYMKLTLSKGFAKSLSSLMIAQVKAASHEQTTKNAPIEPLVAIENEQASEPFGLMTNEQANELFGATQNEQSSEAPVTTQHEQASEPPVTNKNQNNKQIVPVIQNRYLAK